MYPFVFFLHLDYVIMYRYFFDVVKNQTSYKKYLLDLIKKRSKVHVKNKCHDALNLVNHESIPKTKFFKQSYFIAVCINHIKIGLVTALFK